MLAGERGLKVFHSIMKYNVLFVAPGLNRSVLAFIWEIAHMWAGHGYSNSYMINHGPEK